jgi:hypothetical protein
MEIGASHDGRRVLIAVIVVRPDMTFAEDAWSARIAFWLEPGEQLAGVAWGLASFSLCDQATAAGDARPDVYHAVAVGWRGPHVNVGRDWSGA